MRYEYLIAGLPELKSSMAAPLTMETLETQLDELLSDQDKEQLRLLRHHASYGTCKFIQDWYAFNRDLNNSLTIEICKKHNLDIRKHIVGEAPDDVDAEVKSVSKMENLFEREKAIDALRFAWLENRTSNSDFELQNVLAYWLELQMLNRWSVLTTEEGEKVFRMIVADMKKGVRL